MRRPSVSLAVAFALVLGGAHAVFTQGGGGQTPARQWWVNKDKPGQYGKNKVHIKLADLKARHIVENWPTLSRRIREEGFPPGRLLGPNTRAWTEAEIDEWLASRPTAPKPAPAHRRREAEASLET